MKKVVLLTGPTASGKTSHSVSLAHAIGGEIVNFDSLLFYRELTIGSAKPTVEERRGIPHHMVDVRSISEPMNASQFAIEAAPVIDEILGRKKPVILVGGSGFYARALLKGMYHSPTTPAEIRQRSDELYEKEGITPFRALLKEHDPENYRRLHENDHYRIRRAVAHWWTSGTPFSSEKESFTPSASDWQVLNVHLDLPKDEHWKIIQARTEKMVEQGLIQEVQDLLLQGFTGEERPLLSIGYKETLDWLRGLYGSDLAQYKERISLNTRQLAKVQRTWFKKELDKQTFDPRTDGQSLMAAVTEFLQAN